MARKRIEQTVAPTTQPRRWGQNRGSLTTRKRADGSTYHEWRCPYYAMVPVVENGEVVGHERKRRFATSTDIANGKSIVEAEAERLSRESVEAEDTHWRNENVKRGTYVPEPAPVAVYEAPERKRLNIIEVAEQRAKLQVRYVDGQVEGHRHSYKRKQENYYNHLRASAWWSRPMDTLTPIEIHEWFVGFMHTHAETTSARLKSWLISIGKWAQDGGYWPVNHFITLPDCSARASGESERVYSLAEIDAMWNAARTPQERAMLVLLRCGLRQGEALALTAEQIINDTTILVRYTLTDTANVWNDRAPNGNVNKEVEFLGRPKTKTSATKIHIPKQWMPYIRESLECSTGCLVRAYDDGKTNDGKPRLHRFVLGNRFGLVWTEWNASRAMRKLMERAGVEMNGNDSTFHVWRHTFCSDLCAMRANDIELAFLMRHSDVNLSKTVYASARHEELQTYRKYADGITNLTDYIDAIAQFDEDRRKKKKK